MEHRYFSYTKEGKLIEMRKAENSERRVGMPEWISMNKEDEDKPRIPGIYISLARKKARDPIVIDTSAKVV
jgi:hypothetical protein